MSGPPVGAGPHVVIVVRDSALPGPLQTVLVGQAADWASEIGADSIDRVDLAEGADPRNAFARGVDRVRDEHGSAAPVLVVWPEIVQLRAAHAVAALEDLAADADAVVGPIFGGGVYLIGIAGPPDPLLALPADFWSAENGVSLAIPQPGEPPFELGLLRAERGLATSADLFAALVDPCLPPPVMQALDGTLS